MVLALLSWQPGRSVLSADTGLPAAAAIGLISPIACLDFLYSFLHTRGLLSGKEDGPELGRI